jgi:hypothetical protein
MTSPNLEPVAGERNATKADWVEPSVTRLDVGAAEASDGSGPDGGLAS